MLVYACGFEGFVFNELGVQRFAIIEVECGDAVFFVGDVDAKFTQFHPLRTVHLHDEANH